MKNHDAIPIDPIIYPTRFHPNLPVCGMIELWNFPPQCYKLPKIVDSIKNPPDYRLRSIRFV
jgi:hypothetical protein